jgi:excisionase family DNA binding protein
MKNREMKTEGGRGSEVMMLLLDSRDVAAVLKVSPKTVQKLVREGKLPCVQVTARERRFAGRLIWIEQPCYDPSVTVWNLFQ